MVMEEELEWRVVVQGIEQVLYNIQKYSKIDLKFDEISLLTGSCRVVEVGSMGIVVGEGIEEWLVLGSVEEVDIEG